MTAEEKKSLALFLDLTEDYLRDGYKQPRGEYHFSDTGGTTGGTGLPPEQDSLEAIALEIRGCTCCPLHTTRTLAVPGEGVSQPLALVVGEGPGAEEDASGRPFVGRAGQLLDRMLAAVGLSRERNCFIINVVKCRPPNNRDPLPEEIAPCANYLSRQLRLLKPLVILSVGRISTQTLLNTTEGIGKLRGQFTEYRGFPLLPTYHPSALLRDESLKRPVWEDLKILRGRLAELHESYALETSTGS
jgi:DNA polymerase